MSDMHIEHAIIKTIWRDIDRHVDETIRGISEGRGRVVSDPFRGQTTELPLPESVIQFRETIEDDELYEDMQFLGALRGLLRDMVSTTAFGLLSAVDGSAGFVDDASITIYDSDGNELNHCFHEIFFQLDPER